MKLKELGLSSSDIKAKVSKYMIETYERMDFVCEKAKYQYLYDENGEKYLDFYAGIAVNSAGSCNDKVVEAVVDQVKDVMHTFNYPYTIPQALLAEKVCTTIGMDKIFFQNSGTEANEAMIKMARKYGIEKYGPNKYHIVTAKNGFHGRTFGAMSATGQPGNGCQVGFGPMTYGFSYAPYNDLKAFKDACTENTIGIMIEPVQGEGGVHPATQEFMTGLREFCDEKGILLLIDEVQTGWCRTGKVMSYMNYGIKPDIVSMAKALGGGMPIGAICATEEVAKAFSAGSHGTTFGGHPVSCAAALAEVEELLSTIHFPYSVGYGMTECAPLICFDLTKTSRQGSCGRVIPRMEVRIDSTDPHNIPGEILTRGMNVMLGYYKNPEETAEAIDLDGWLHTGDLGTLDEDGYLFIRGRKKTMLLGANGQNIYPEEIEDKILSLTNFEECVVVQRGEKLVALVYISEKTMQQKNLTPDFINNNLDMYRKNINDALPKFANISAIELKSEEFEKTPKRSIRRYLYK